jgi:hypothetical protein
VRLGPGFFVAKALPIVTMGLLCLLGEVSPAAAQTVRGTLVEAGTDRPIPGAFVILEDSTGQAISTTLTGSAGTWLLRAPIAGTYWLRADRIGYASVVSDSVVLRRGESASYRLAVDVAPIGLAELAVEGADGQCELLAEEGLAVYRVWEEARKALAAIVWTGQQPYYRFDAVHYQRRLDEDGVPAGPAEYEEVRYFGRHPFRSIPTRDLVLGGFVQTVGGARQYYGPDAEVMLSTAFLRRHCFELVETDDSDLIGLEFEPVDEARVIDIAGVMWLDPVTSELRRLDFRYENLDLSVDTQRLGGTVEFERLPSGAWIVQHWAIRVPIIEQGPPRSSGGRPLPPRRLLTGIDEGGGQVTAVFLTSRLLGYASTDTLPVRPPPDSLIVRYPIQH